MGFLVMIDDHMTNAIEDQDHLLLYATCKLGCPLPKKVKIHIALHCFPTI